MNLELSRMMCHFSHHTPTWKKKASVLKDIGIIILSVWPAPPLFVSLHKALKCGISLNICFRELPQNTGNLDSVIYHLTLKQITTSMYLRSSLWHTDGSVKSLFCSLPRSYIDYNPQCGTLLGPLFIFAFHTNPTSGNSYCNSVHSDYVLGPHVIKTAILP